MDLLHKSNRKSIDTLSIISNRSRFISFKSSLAEPIVHNITMDLPLYSDSSKLGGLYEVSDIDNAVLTAYELPSYKIYEVKPKKLIARFSHDISNVPFLGYCKFMKGPRNTILVECHKNRTKYKYGSRTGLFKEAFMSKYKKEMNSM